MTDHKPTLAQIRQAVANYIASEGCGCCADYEKHKRDQAVLARLLRVKPYTDKSGYDFSRYKQEAR